MIGRRLAHYQIVAPIGAGGMGEVFRATDTKLERDVALKVLPSEVSLDPARLERFRREARALAALDHPGIVSVFSVEESDGVHFLTMQLVEGESLDRIIAPGPVALSRFFEIAVPLAEALSAAHERGIVHRDLKPANVMVTPEQRVKVLDFGLAKLDAPDSDAGSTSSPTETRANLTGEGQVFGTVAYMSPEQARGGRVDARSDVFSLGVVLYEMLAGERPFKGANPADVVSSILRDTPAPVTEKRAELPPELSRILRRCLEKDPRDRYQTSRDVYNELREARAASAGLPLSASSGAVSGPVAAAAPRARWKGPALAASAAVLLGVAVFVFLRSRGAPTAGRGAEAAGEPGAIRSIAVLPLDNYSGDPNQDYFAEGMTDELTADLATISRLRVISRGSAMQFKGKNRPTTPQIAKALNVDAIVEGSVIRSGDKVRITAQLIDARADKHLWAKSFERNSSDVLALQDELASAIAKEIHVQLTPAEASRLTRASAVNPEAYDAYLKGRYHFNRPSDENLKKAIEFFEDATRKDPNYAPACSGLSDAYLWAGYNEGFLTASQGRAKAKEAAEKAIQLDDQAAEGHASLATFKVFYEYDWAGAEKEYRRAFELNPSYAFAHDQFSLALGMQGRFDEAIAEGRRAAELDPLSPQIPLDTALVYGFKRDFQAARERARRGSELDPTLFLNSWLYGWVEIQAGMARESIPHFEKSKAMDSPAFVSAWLAYAYGASGDRARALAELEDLKKRSLNGTPTAFNLALVHLGLGDRERTLDYLEKAHAADTQWLGWLKLDRAFDPLRSEPRFAALLKKINLDK